MNSPKIIFQRLLICTMLFSPGISYAQTPQAKPTEANDNSPVDDEDAPVKIESKEGYTIYDLSTAIKKSLEVSPSVESAMYDKDASSAQLQEAKAASFLPLVDLKVLGGYAPDVPDGSGPEGGFPDVEFSWDHLGPFIQLRLEAFQPIYTFGKISNLRKAAQLGVEAKDEGVQKARNELILQVKRAYIGLASLYSFREFVSELQTRSGKAKEIVEKQIQKKSSEVTDIDLLRVQVFEAEAERRLVEINNNIDFVRMTLKILMGLPRDAKIDIAEQRLRMDDTLIDPVETYLQIAQQNRPEITQLKDLVGIREAMMKGVQAGFYPSFGLGGFYRYGFAPDRESVNNPFLVDDFNQNAGGAFVGLSQSLSFHLTNSRYKQARALYEKARADEQRGLQGIEIEIRKSHTNAIAKQQAVESAKRGYKIGRSLVLATTLNFGIGVGPPKDLVEAFVAYSTVRINFLQTLNDYYMALAELTNAVGKEVTNLQY